MFVCFIDGIKRDRETQIERESEREKREMNKVNLSKFWLDKVKRFHLLSVPISSTKSTA